MIFSHFTTIPKVLEFYVFQFSVLRELRVLTRVFSFNSVLATRWDLSLILYFNMEYNDEFHHSYKFHNFRTPGFTFRELTTYG